MNPNLRFRPKDRDALLRSLRAGVVPRAGQHLIQVGRAREVETLISDIDQVAEGGAAFRLVIGEYGAGKTFFLNLVRSIALEKKLVVAAADLNPDRRLQGSGGQVRSLYAELMRNLSTRSSPDGGGLTGIIEQFINTAQYEAQAGGMPTNAALRQKLVALTELVGGYDFAQVVACYWQASQDGNEQVKSAAIQWLRGEFTTKTEARQVLNVRSIVDDASVYDQLKLIASFVRLAGFRGFVVTLDEMVNLYKLPNSNARSSNYEQILRILNDTLQGNVVGLGFILGGTPEFLTDTRRGLYSYPALQGRLGSNPFAKNGFVDFSGPVIQLASLTPEEFYVLLQNIRHVHAAGDSTRYLVDDEGLQGFMAHCQRHLGDRYFRTPRSAITAFVNMLAVLEQNETSDWSSVLNGIPLPVDGAPMGPVALRDADNELTLVRL